MKTKVNNMPEYAWNYKYIVASIDYEGHWFWGAYNDVMIALEVARTIDAGVLPIEEIEKID